MGRVEHTVVLKGALGPLKRGEEKLEGTSKSPEGAPIPLVLLCPWVPSPLQPLPL